MALNKKQTSMVVKVVIVFVIISFVATLGGVFSQVANTSGGARGGQTAGGTDQLSQIGAQVKPQIDANEQALNSKPKDYALLKQLGDQYFDWAARVAQAAPQAGYDSALWARSAGYYERAVAVQAGDPAVGTDMAIATFYSGDVAKAITIVEGVMKKDPKFAQAPFNAGIFYRQAGQNAKAVAAWQTYLKLEPKGDQATRAQQFITETQQAGNTQAPSSVGGTASTTATGSATTTGQ